MKVTYTTTFTATCPVDGSTDIYELTVTSESAWYRVEKLLEVIGVATKEPAFQEEITDRIAQEFPGAIVETTGEHSGVRTAVMAF